MKGLLHRLPYFIKIKYVEDWHDTFDKKGEKIIYDIVNDFLPKDSLKEQEFLTRNEKMYV